MSTKVNYNEEVLSQAQTIRATVEFINIVNDLWYDKSIELVLFRNPLVDKRDVLCITKIVDFGCWLWQSKFSKSMSTRVKL